MVGLRRSPSTARHGRSAGKHPAAGTAAEEVKANSRPKDVQFGPDSVSVEHKSGEQPESATRAARGPQPETKGDLVLGEERDPWDADGKRAIALANAARAQISRPMKRDPIGNKPGAGAGAVSGKAAAARGKLERRRARAYKDSLRRIGHIQLASDPLVQHVLAGGTTAGAKPKRRRLKGKRRQAKDGIARQLAQLHRHGGAVAPVSGAERSEVLN